MWCFFPGVAAIRGAIGKGLLAKRSDCACTSWKVDLRWVVHQVYRTADSMSPHREENLEVEDRGVNSAQKNGQTLEPSCIEARDTRLTFSA